jgi:CBS domain-containing protein
LEHGRAAEAIRPDKIQRLNGLGVGHADPYCRNAQQWNSLKQKNRSMKMGSVAVILKKKGYDVYTITPEATVFEALQLMADKNIGCLVVQKDGEIVGIISERDYARKIILKGRFSKDVKVSEIMTTEVLRIDPDEDIERCMELMTYHRARHLPVFENDRLIGIISVGDIVKAIIEKQEETIKQLENYIKGRP